MTLYIQSFVLLSVPNKLIVIMLNVIMPSVVKPNVVGPLESLARDYHSSLLQTLVGYSCKKFCNKDTWIVQGCLGLWMKHLQRQVLQSQEPGLGLPTGWLTPALPVTPSTVTHRALRHSLGHCLHHLAAVVASFSDLQKEI
jgi:hypothetical protein